MKIAFPKISMSPSDEITPTYVKLDIQIFNIFIHIAFTQPSRGKHTALQPAALFHQPHGLVLNN